MRYKRKVFGRRRIEMDKTAFLIELREETLVVRERWSRREREATFPELVNFVFGKEALKLK